MNRTAITICVVLITGLSSTVQSSPITPEMLRDLNSADFAAREKVTQQLLADETLSPDVITELYNAVKSPEARHRLLLVARHHLIRRGQVEEDQQPGAIGIMHQAVTSKQIPNIGHPAVRVVQTFPGFPAYARLKPGDLIVAVNHERFGRNVGIAQITNQFRDMIQQTASGERLTLHVYRDGHLLKPAIQIRLASLNALRDIYEPHTGDLQPQHRNRWLEFRKTLKNFREKKDPLTVKLPVTGSSDARKLPDAAVAEKPVPRVVPGAPNLEEQMRLMILKQRILQQHNEAEANKQLEKILRELEEDKADR